ncbi:hypothetical protein ACL02U_15130 [Streptomyces sp. MS06]|uniref:hypothetical protein n=1 Tax=Streptomyces sp. MS06 TaxID=3385974 RepID=UPI0039A3C4D1
MNEMVRRLTTLLPPPSAGAEPLPWEEAQAVHGTALPQDFRDFVDTYGYGSLDDVLRVCPAGGRGGEVDDPAVRGLPSTVEGEFRTFHGTVRFPPWPAEGALLSWGTTPVGYDLFWRKRGNDPDTWPVVIVGYRSGTAVELSCGMAEFLVRMLGDPLDRPVGITGIPGHPHSRYLSVREEADLEDAGEDPWEYLDDFWDERERERADSDEVAWVQGPGRHQHDNPPVPRLTVQGFGLDGDHLRVSATLDLEPTAPVTAAVRIGGPNGDVLRREGLPVSTSGGAGDPLVLDIWLHEDMNDTSMSWRDLIHAMSHEPEWCLSVSVKDWAIGAARGRRGIVTGTGMHESGVNTAYGAWP